MEESDEKEGWNEAKQSGWSPSSAELNSVGGSENAPTGSSSGSEVISLVKLTRENITQPSTAKTSSKTVIAALDARNLFFL